MRININQMSDAGRLHYLVELLQDITEALEAREGLSRSEQGLVDLAKDVMQDYNQIQSR